MQQRQGEKVGSGGERAREEVRGKKERVDNGGEEDETNRRNVNE